MKNSAEFLRWALGAEEGEKLSSFAFGVGRGFLRIWNKIYWLLVQLVADMWPGEEEDLSLLCCNYP